MTCDGGVDVPDSEQLRQAVETIRFALATGQMTDEDVNRLKRTIGFCEFCDGAGRIVSVVHKLCHNCAGLGYTK